MKQTFTRTQLVRWETGWSRSQ